MATPARDTSGFLRASHQSQALCLGTLGASGLLWPIAVWGFPSPLRFLAAWTAAGAGVWLLSRARRHWRLHEMEDILLGRLEGGVPASLTVDPEFLQEGKLHPQLERVVRVIRNSRFKDLLEVDSSKVRFEDDGAGGRSLISWGLKCVKDGGLAAERVQKELRELLKKSLDSSWRITIDSLNDSVFGTQVDDLPKLCFPPLWPVAQSVAEAIKNYPGKIQLGLTENNEVVSTSVWDYPHMKVIGETNAGKSVAVKSIIEQLRAAGWMLVLGDGKGVDFNGFNAADPDNHYLPPPGTIAYGSGRGRRAMTYVGAIVIAYNMVLERLEFEGAALDNREDPEAFPPLFILLDEIKALRDRWSTELAKEEFAAVEHMISEIAATGRGSRIHMAIISQDAYRGSIPKEWVGNVRMSLVVGRPTFNTIQNAFDDDRIKDKVKQVRETMRPADKGRCIVATDNDLTGHIDAVQYQNYFSYSPGSSWERPNMPDGTAAEWSKFKTEVSDRVPRLYSRIWFKIDSKSEAQIAYEDETGEDLGFIDFDQFTVDEVKRMKRVNLDMRNSDGKIVPNPEYAKYDPNSPLYVCRPPAHATRRYINPVL